MLVGKDEFLARAAALLVERGGVVSPNAREALNAAYDVIEPLLQPSLFDSASD